MPIDTIDQEDALVPLAAESSTLYLFSPVDGSIYRHCSGYEQIERVEGRGTFAVPGDAALYRLIAALGSFEAVVTPFDRSRTGARHQLRLDRSLTPTGLIPGRDDRWAVFTRPGSDTVSLASLGTGAVVQVEVPQGSTPLMVDDEGVLIQADDGSWHHGPRQHGHGKVVSVGEGAFITCQRWKDARVFTLVSGREHVRLIPPSGWQVERAVVAGAAFVAVCTHAQYGYGVWRGAQIEALDGQVELFSLGGQPPVIRQTGVALGTKWLLADGTILQGAIQATGSVVADHFSLGDLPCTLVRTSNPSSELLISLHGGPDSHEWDGLRYGGLYRNLADRGMDTLVVNYPGSRGLGEELQQRAWERWDDAVLDLARELERFVRSHHYAKVCFLGVSFGAWVALQVASTLHADQVLCASPVLDLTSHVRSHLADPDFSEWANSRFGGDLASATRGDVRAAKASAVTVIAPTADEAVDPRLTAEICRQRGWQHIPVDGGHYPDPIAAPRRWHLFQRLLLGRD